MHHRNYGWTGFKAARILKTIIWQLSLKTVSEANCSEHWTKKSKRHRQQQFFIRQLFKQEPVKIALPCEVKMVRLASRTLDSDNLVSAFKWIRDELSECLIPSTKKGKGRSDSDPRITWVYDQGKSSRTGIRIEISFSDA